MPQKPQKKRRVIEKGESKRTLEGNLGREQASTSNQDEGKIEALSEGAQVTIGGKEIVWRKPRRRKGREETKILHLKQKKSYHVGRNGILRGYEKGDYQGVDREIKLLWSRGHSARSKKRQQRKRTQLD